MDKDFDRFQYCGKQRIISTTTRHRYARLIFIEQKRSFSGYCEILTIFQADSLISTSTLDVPAWLSAVSFGLKMHGDCTFHTRNCTSPLFL